MFAKTFSNAFRKSIVVPPALLAVVLGAGTLPGQQTPAPVSATGTEFPVTLRQNAVAGKTKVGTKVEANLVIATLVNGVVIPRNALLSGEVTESVAKTKAEPSHLALRIDSATWKNGSAPLKLCLTAWYYPAAPMAAPDLSYQPPDAANSPKNWNGAGPYPDPNNPIAQQPFPGRDSDKDSSPTLPSPSSIISKNRVLMKNVNAARNTDGVVTLASSHSNIKLDKVTTYVLVPVETPPKN